MALSAAEIDRQRAAAVAEALSWERTPFHDCAGIKGVGTDCAWFPFRVYHAVGLMPAIEIPNYSPQFLLHSDKELYLDIVEAHGIGIQGDPLPGDFVIWKFGRCFSHGAIVIQWPRIIHAHKPAGGVILDDALASQLLLYDPRGRIRPRKTFTLPTWTAAA